MQLTVLDNQELSLLLLASALLLLFAFFTGRLFERFGAPRVVGEIAGGMLLGSSGLYALFPQYIGAILQGFPEQGKLLNVFYQLGLIFLMFSSGFNTGIDLKHGTRKYVVLLLVGATILPMGVGFFVYRFFEPFFIGSAQNSISFLLVFLISIAITSIPVISKIFFDLNLMHTPFSDTVLTTSTLQDLLLWILLNVSLDFAAEKQLQISDLLLTVLYTSCLFLLSVLAARMLKKQKQTLSPSSFFTLTLAGLFLFIVLMNQLRINLMYSAFLFGYMAKAATENSPKAAEKMQSLYDFSFSLFVPIYFALVGVQVNILHQFSLSRFLIFFAVACTLEFLGCVIVLAFTNLKRRAVLNFAITMNARGGPGIVLATVAYNHQIISLEFFTVLILTTMISSLIAGYWLRYQKKVGIDIYTNMEKVPIA